MDIIEYYGSERKEHWLAQLRTCEWEAGKLLFDLLTGNCAEEFLGESPKIFLLADGDDLVSFCTLAQKDDIPDCELMPWIGFVYTFPEYRGHRYAGKLIEHAEKTAYNAGHSKIYISTNHTGLYEKYGYMFFETRKDLNGDNSLIYIKTLREQDNELGRDEKMHDRIKEYIYANKERLLSMIYELVAVHSEKGEPSEGAPFGIGPRAALDKMIGICRHEGFVTRLCYDVVGTADLLPEGSNEMPALGILGHLDVVPAEGQEGWLTDPFKKKEKNGILYGRGVIDDKGPLCAAFMAMKCIQTLGIPLKKGVRLIFGTDEENGSEDLSIYMANEDLPVNVFTPDAAFPLINIEKGRLLRHFKGTHIFKGGSVVSFHGGSIPNAVPDRAECVVSDISAIVIENEIYEDTSGAEFKVTEEIDGVRIICIGRSAHASTPETGINAVTALIGLLCRLPLARHRESDKQRDMLHGLNEIFPFGETDGTHAGLKAEDDVSGGLTLAFSIFDMENGECSGCIDIRFPTCMTLHKVDTFLRKALSDAGFTAESIEGQAPHIVDENSEFVQKLLRVYERCEGEKGRCLAIGGGTYVHNVPGGVAFGVERGDTDYKMHGANEWITVDELLKDAIIFTEAIIEICG